MAYIIAEPCIGVKDTAWVDACPVDCIHPKKDEALSAQTLSFTSTRRNVLIVGPAFRPVWSLQSLFWMIFRGKWTEYESINAAYFVRKEG